SNFCVSAICSEVVSLWRNEASSHFCARSRHDKRSVSVLVSRANRKHFSASLLYSLEVAMNAPSRERLSLYEICAPPYRGAIFLNALGTEFVRRCRAVSRATNIVGRHAAKYHGTKSCSGGMYRGCILSVRRRRRLL